MNDQSKNQGSAEADNDGLQVHSMEVGLKIVTTASTLIGVYSDRTQSGKSTVAAWLTAKRGYCRGHFASTLKNMVGHLMTIYGYHPNEVQHHLFGTKKEEPLEKLPGHPTARYLLQSLGTAWGRGLVHDDLWCEALRRPLFLQLGNQPVVIDDLRFPNEWELIRNFGGTIIKIVRLPEPDEEDPIECEALLYEHQPDFTLLAADVDELHSHLDHLFPAGTWEPTAVEPPNDKYPGDPNCTGDPKTCPTHTKPTIPPPTA